MSIRSALVATASVVALTVGVIGQQNPPAPRRTSSPAPLKAKGMERMPQKGIYSVTVPGAVAGWDTMRAKFGKLPMSDLMAPAIYYAENGFPVSEVIADAWGRATDGLAAEPYAAKAFL